MIQETRIFLPVADNEGKPLTKAREAIEHELLVAFGGFNLAGSVGVWRSPTGKIHKDVGVMYAVAAEWLDADNYLAMRAIAKTACRLMRQECIYVAFPSGVEYIEPTSEEK